MKKIGIFISLSIIFFVIISIAYVALAIFTAPFSINPLIPDLESFFYGLRNILITSCIISLFIIWKSR